MSERSSCHHHKVRWLSIPAFSGTTPEDVAATCTTSRFNFQTATRDHPCCCDGAGAPEACAAFPPLMRARGTPDARRIRSLVCKVVKAHERSRHGHAGGIRRSARGSFNGLLRIYPRCSTLGLNHRSRGLTRRVSPSVRGEKVGAAPWRKAMRRDNATWAVRVTVWSST